MTALIESRLSIRDAHLAKLCAIFEREGRATGRATWKANTRLYLADPWKIQRVVFGFNHEPLSASLANIKNRMACRRMYGVTLNSEIAMRAARLAIYVLYRREREEARGVWDAHAQEGELVL